VRPLNTHFVIADGARARWVKRSDQADDFVTVRELVAGPEPRGEPDGVAFASRGGQRFNIGEKKDAIRQRKLRFAEEVAEAINAEAAAGGLERLAVVAPARMLGAIRQRLGPEASARLVQTLSKDLTKTPDHELGGWLRRLERG
jgi:protein required for attachment to host cells